MLPSKNENENNQTDNGQNNAPTRVLDVVDGGNVDPRPVANTTTGPPSSATAMSAQARLTTTESVVSDEDSKPTKDSTASESDEDSMGSKKDAKANTSSIESAETAKKPAPKTNEDSASSKKQAATKAKIPINLSHQFEGEVLSVKGNQPATNTKVTNKSSIEADKDTVPDGDKKPAAKEGKVPPKLSSDGDEDSLEEANGGHVLSTPKASTGVARLPTKSSDDNCDSDTDFEESKSCRSKRGSKRGSTKKRRNFGYTRSGKKAKLGYVPVKVSNGMTPGGKTSYRTKWFFDVHSPEEAMHIQKKHESSMKGMATRVANITDKEQRSVRDHEVMDYLLATIVDHGKKGILDDKALLEVYLEVRHNLDLDDVFGFSEIWESITGKQIEEFEEHYQEELRRQAADRQDGDDHADGEDLPKDGDA